MGLESSSSESEDSEDEIDEVVDVTIANQNCTDMNSSTIENGFVSNTESKSVDMDEDKNDLNDDPSSKSMDIIDNTKRRKKKRRGLKKKIELDKKNDDVGRIKLPKRETVYVEVNRNPEIQVKRLKLPILGEEQSVMECINNNAIVIIAGETGKNLFKF